MDEQTEATSRPDEPCVIIYIDRDGNRLVQSTMDVEQAIRYVETLYNDHEVQSAQVYKLHEIEIDLTEVQRVVLTDVA